MAIDLPDEGSNTSAKLTEALGEAMNMIPESSNGNRVRRNATLKDVAVAAGVTPMTVSNVLNGRHGQVGIDTRDRVLAAVQLLGYRPNAVARRLKSRRTAAIGVLVLDDVPEFLSDPFTTRVVTGLANVATDNNYSLVLQGVRSDNLTEAPLLSQLETDGVCALLSGPESGRYALVRRLSELNVPLVLIQESIAMPGVCCIRQDDWGGAREIARHLLGRGARKLMMLVPAEQWPAMQVREAAVRTECEGAGASLRLVRCGDESLGATQAALAEAIGRYKLPDAIVGGNDRMALAALKWLREHAIAVPARVRVTGFNDFDFAAYATPELTTVRSAAYEMGRRAGEELLVNFATGSFSSVDISLPVQFKVAASS
jgi:LacI family transcriptional regulator